MEGTAAPTLGSQDPIVFARAFDAPADQEIAAAIASSLSFGRVTAFAPVIAALLHQARTRGGPAAWVARFDHRDADALSGLRYRWVSGVDMALWCARPRS